MEEKKSLPASTAKELFSDSKIKARFEQMLGKKSQGFITSVLQIVASNKQLAKADPQSVYNAAATAATLDLPINNNLGFAWIVPYKTSTKIGNVWHDVYVAQFQLGWKGFTQLALRTGQYLRLNVISVYENQFKSFNTLTEELDADFSIDGQGEVIGYCSYFKLLNGFEKMTYWSKVKVNEHALKYSKSYASKDAQSPWKDKDQFHEMAKKTVLKNMLSKWGILSIEMQQAFITDQAVISNAETMEVDYIDNEPIEISVEEKKEAMKGKAKTDMP